MTRILEVDLDARPRRRRAGRREPRRHARGRRRRASTTRPTRRASRSARSAATSPRTPAARTASSTASPSNHVLAAEIVLPDGELVELSVWDDPGPDLLGALRRLRGDARDRDQSSRCASCARPRRCGRCLRASRTPTTPAAPSRATIAAGILPAAIEMMDAAHDRGGRGGRRRELSRRLRRRADRRARRRRGAGRGGPRRAWRRSAAVHGALRDPHRRRSRPSARPCGAGARPPSPRWAAISPDYYVQDGVVPRTKLPEVLRRIDALSRRARPARRQRLPRGRRQPPPARPLRRPRRGRGRRGPRSSRSKILEACVDAGGSITGEHGVGTDKACAMPLMFGEDDLAAMQRVASRVRPERPRESRQGSSRRRASAARCRARTAPTRSRRPGLPTGSEIARARAGRPHVRRRGRHPPLGADARRSPSTGSGFSLDPPGDPTLGGLPRRRPLRPAAPPLRDDARPRDRRHGRARRTARARARAARS